MNKIDIAIIVFGITSIIGYVTNIFWIFGNMNKLNGEILISVLGVLVPPLGVLHGLYILF